MRKLPTLILTLIILALSAFAWIVVLSLGSIIVYISSSPEQEQKQRTYEIIRLNSESNMREDGEDYLLRYMNAEKILRYSFDAEEATDYLIEVPEGIYIEIGGTIVGDCIYYVLSDDTVRRFDCGKQIDEEVLSREDILRLYGEEKVSEYFSIMIKSYGECLLLSLGDSRKEYNFVCPVAGDLKKDCIEVNDLFPEENKTGMEEEIVYQGIRFQRYYDIEKERYILLEAGAEESGRTIFTNKEGSTTIRVDEKLVSLDHKRGVEKYSYYVEGDPKEHRINCLSNSKKYEYSVIQKDKLTVENGEIIGLLHVVENMRCDSYDPSQDQLKYDVLFRLNPETGESGILYRAEDNLTRIIGYRDETVYLLKDYKIYSQTIGANENTLLLELPQDYDYRFDWQGGYLIVMCEYEKYKYKIAGAYKIE